ncbi:unnamed protein product, partial [Prorocentrum cordatum]
RARAAPRPPSPAGGRPRARAAPWPPARPWAAWRCCCRGRRGEWSRPSRRSGSGSCLARTPRSRARRSRPRPRATRWRGCASPSSTCPARTPSSARGATWRRRSCCSSWPRAPRPGGRREKERPHRSCPPAIGDVLSRGGWEVITAEEAGLRASRFVAHAEQRLARALEEQQQLAELLRREQLARQAAEAQARQASARADRAAQEALRAREATDSAWAEAQQARVECEKHRLLSKQLLYSELRREALEGGAEPYPYGVRVCDEDPVCLVAWQVGRPEPETRLLSCAVLRARLGEGRGRNSSPSLGEGPLAAPPGGRAAGPPALRL